MISRLAGALEFTLIVLLLLTGCERQHLKVTYMPPPDYPFVAASKGLQGTVIVRATIGTDGKVTSATGKGATTILVDAAEENVKGWRFEVPAHARFPIEHEIRYKFTFNKYGAPNTFPTIVTDLPDAVEIIGSPVHGDTAIIVPSERGEETPKGKQ